MKHYITWVLLIINFLMYMDLRAKMGESLQWDLSERILQNKGGIDLLRTYSQSYWEAFQILEKKIK